MDDPRSALDDLLHGAASLPDADAARALAAARQRLLAGTSASASGAAQPASATADFGRYTIGAPIGSGGMGRVFAAKDGLLDREVAIKLLRGGLPAERLRDEARALAQLSHPNIVTVFDLGPTQVADEIFVVMERVPGLTLRAWLDAQRRSPAAVLAIFVDVGRGLAAAHRAGIVHGDVKPDNVIVTPEGSAKVLDFGLARLGAIDETTGDATGRGGPRGQTRETSSAKNPSPVARSSERLWGGTPRYMAPEQRAGAAPAARADQYAFCVALREALLPRAGPAADPAIPSVWRRVIARGLAERPEDRWPTMESLLDALARRPATSRWLAPVGFASVGVATIAWLAWPAASRSQDGCEAHAPQWTAARKAELTAAFVGIGTPYGASLGRRVSARLDERAQVIATAWDAACEAATPELRECVAAADAELGAAVDALVAGGAPALERANGVVSLLADPSACSDPARAPRVPAAIVSGWRTTLGEASTALNAADTDGAIALLRGVHEDATARAAGRIAAEARWMEGAALTLRSGDEAEAVLTSAIEEAAAAGADEIEISATGDLVSFLRGTGRFADAERWVRHGMTIADRMSASDGYRARLAVEQAHIDRALGKNAVAEQRYADAISVLRREVGDDHPLVAIAMNGVGTLALERGDHETARAQYCDAEGILVGAFGADTPRTIETGINCAIGMMRRDPQAARDRLHALHAAAVRWWGPEDARVGNALANLASVELQLRQVDVAIEHMRRSDAIVVATLGEAHPNRLLGLLNLGLAMLELPDFAGAERAFVQATALAESSLGAEHIVLAEAWGGLARARIGLGQIEPAVDAAERAVALQDRVGTDPVRKAESRSVLAQALVAAGRDRSRAVGMARDALVVFGNDAVLAGERARAQAVVDAAAGG